MQDEIGWSRVYDPRTQKLLVRILVAQCELAARLTDILLMLYPTDGSTPTVPTDANGLKDAKMRIHRHRENLTEWITHFSVCASTETGSPTPHLSVTLYANLLNIYY
jgi:hypothetical protein